MRLENKKQFVDSFKKRLEESRSCILTNYQGMAVNDITELRSKLRKSECAMKVVKNRLVRRAIKDIKNEVYDELDSFLKGPTAVLLAGKDPSAAVKIFKEYADKNEFMEFKAGVINDNMVTDEQLMRLADLPSREVMLGKTVNVINAPIQGFYSALSGIIKNFVYALNAVKEKLEEEGPAPETEKKEKESSQADQAEEKEAAGEKPEVEEEASQDSAGEEKTEEKETAKGKENNKDESKEKEEGDDGKEEK
jgi:large subunit ribosomal protein L10